MRAITRRNLLTAGSGDRQNALPSRRMDRCPTRSASARSGRDRMLKDGKLSYGGGSTTSSLHPTTRTRLFPATAIDNVIVVSDACPTVTAQGLAQASVFDRLERFARSPHGFMWSESDLATMAKCLLNGSPPSQGTIIGSKRLQHGSLLVDHDPEPSGVQPECEPTPPRVTVDALLKNRRQPTLSHKGFDVGRLDAQAVREGRDVDRSALVVQGYSTTLGRHGHRSP